MSLDTLWGELVPIGLAASGGYRRFAWSREDAAAREWFDGAARARGLDVIVDRNGNQWAWWGDPDRDGPGVVTGSHLDSVADGGAFDGPLGVISGLLVIDALRARGVVPRRPLAVVNMADEEGARFGVACTGSRLLTGGLDPDRARGLRDDSGVDLASAMKAAGHDPAHLGRDDETLRRVSTFVELHIEQGRALAALSENNDDSPVGVGRGIWPHGRWRLDLTGAANHAGTTPLADRNDPMLDLARVVVAARAVAQRLGGLATIGRVRVTPNSTNAVPSLVEAWLDSRAPDEDTARAVVGEVADVAGVAAVEESWSPLVELDAALRDRLVTVLGAAPVLATGAGHDAGVLAAAGVPTAMLFVRNPTGVSHSPAEHAERDDCLAGVDALTTVLTELVS